MRQPKREGTSLSELNLIAKKLASEQRQGLLSLIHTSHAEHRGGNVHSNGIESVRPFLKRAKGIHISVEPLELFSCFGEHASRHNKRKDDADSRFIEAASNAVGQCPYILETEQPLNTSLTKAHT